MSARKFSRIPSGPQRRYRPHEKAKVLRLADRVGVAKTVDRTGVSPWSVYRWLRDRELARSAGDPDGLRGLGRVQKPPRIQVPEAMQKQVLAVWRNNRGFGPSQIHNQLRRVGVRCDTKTVRKIIEAHGYTPPGMKPPRIKEDRRFEASRPLELVQMDVLQFHVHAQRLYLILALDDHSRFIVGWALLQRETMDDAIACLEEAIRRYGKPEAVLTDRGAVFHTWSGIGQFDRVLEAYGIDHLLSAPEHPKTLGKVEAVNKAIQKELIDRVEFRNYLDAKEQIGRWVDEFNHQRTHQGLGGILVPADRFYGRADRVLARIEEARAGNGRDPVPPELETKEADREVTLFQLRLVADIIEVWLFGRRIARLEGSEEVS
ncbi:MAG: DDE-type integrase/transposase/recombinase [candidate division NC10 bacterium]|nr:DDE-type integrase/transposase/recombinase [candidate division NC10 bacterium]